MLAGDSINHRTYINLLPLGAILARMARDGVELRFIQPGKPVQNAHVKGLDSRFRGGCVLHYWVGPAKFTPAQAADL